MKTTVEGSGMQGGYQVVEVGLRLSSHRGQRADRLRNRRRESSVIGTRLRQEQVERLAQFLF